VGEVLALQPEDLAILDLECPTIVGHTCKVVRLAPGPVDVAALRQRVASRIGEVPILTRRLGGSATARRWVVDESFDIDRHIGPADVTGPLDDDSLAALVADLFAQHLPRDRPLWRMDVAPLVDGGVIVIWRLHHALADGTTAVRWAKALLWDEVAGPAAPAPAPSTPVVSDMSHDDARRRWQLAGFLAREFSEGGRSPFDGHVGTRREIGFATMRISELHGAAHRAGGATVNDALLSIVTGAVRRWVEAQHGRLPDIRVRVPVSLHHEADQAGNRDSFFSLNLPLHETDPVTRLREIHAATQRRKLHADAEREDLLLRELTHVRSLSRFVTRLQASPRQFALCVSNVPGPRGPVSVLGMPVLSLSGLAEIGQRHALRVAAVSLGDQMSLGFCADPSIVPGVRLIAAAAATEAMDLISAS
jgi:diacylglycerol O-acyltransferase / wax synthase